MTPRESAGDRVRQFFKTWGDVLTPASVCLMIAVVGYQLHQGRVENVRESQRILEAKQRIENDRQSIAETRKSVAQIQDRLEFNDVPDRLKRIEEGVGHLSTTNEEAIKELDKRQRSLVEALHMILGIPRDEIIGMPPKIPTAIPDGEVKGEQP